MEKFPDEMTIGEKYRPAMAIIDPVKAKEYFESCVEHTMRKGKSREEAESIERQNIGYFAGYYDQDTRIRVERLFSCKHPIFGRAIEYNPTWRESLLLGHLIGTSCISKKGENI